MTNKQEKTLVLFAQNHSVEHIARVQKVKISTIRSRIKALSKNHPREFGNAAGLREVYKRNRDAIKNLSRFSCRNKYQDLEKIVSEDINLIQYKF